MNGLKLYSANPTARQTARGKMSTALCTYSCFDDALQKWGKPRVSTTDSA